MSGMLYYNFREGDRSEYLANYLLSGIGLVTPVPRQEDIGYDFYCQLSDQENQHLTFGVPFIIQIKSDTIKSITYGSENQNNWKKDQIDWLKRLEIPILFGFVDKKSMALSIYNCSTLRYIFISDFNPTRLEFVPKINRVELETQFPRREKIESWNENTKSDGYKYIIDLGKPIVTLSNADIYNMEILKLKKKLLRDVIKMEQANIHFFRLKLPYFCWVKKIITDQSNEVIWFHSEFNDNSKLVSLFNSVAPFLISIAINLEKNNRKYLIESFKQVLKEIQPDLIPIEIKNEYSNLFQID